jgi:putative peptidoglycan lipid II flippase
MHRIGHAGLTLSTSLGACLNAGLLFWFLRRRGVYRPLAGWVQFASKQMVALFVFAIVLLWIVGPSTLWLNATLWAKIGRLAWVIAAGAIAYFAALWLMGFRLADFSRHESS